MNHPSTVTIIGAGAIGGTVGAHLARHSVPTLLVDSDREHVAAMNARGLTIRHADDSITVSVRAVERSELSGPLDLGLLAVKAQHTAAALRASP